LDGMRYTLTRSRPPPDQAQVNLSPRETEIVRLVAKGLPNKAIAAVLEISSWTVATHLRRVFAKLAVGSRAEMVARVLQEGLLESNE
jgi:DNA-binding NarL/FixJ family response regulator